MNTSDDTAAADRSLRFLFEQADIRGETVHLDRSFQELLEIHQYAPGVAELLGEFLAAAALLSSTIKFDGRLILQARSEGQIPLIMAESTSEFALRGIVRGAQEATGSGIGQLLPGGQLVITIDPSKGQRYQGIVPLVEDSLARSLENYFMQSEQLDTRFWLTSNGTDRAAGMLLQQLPAQLTTDRAERDAQWQHACTLAGTLEDEELLNLPAESILHRLYHEDALRVFEPQRLRFQCSCSRERTLNALLSLGTAEIRSMLEEMDDITMDCEFCNQQYTFSSDDLAEYLTPQSGQSLH